MQAAAESKLADIIMLSDLSKECMDEALKIAPNGKCMASFDATIYEPGLDGIVIATPSALHKEQSVKAFGSGKAVFCQKPLGRNAEEVYEVVHAAKKANKLLGADFSYRYTAAFQSIYHVIQSTGPINPGSMM
jgi:predicted dehydrogenase